MDCSKEFTVPFCLLLTHLVETVNTQAIVFWGVWNRRDCLSFGGWDE